MSTYSNDPQQNIWEIWFVISVILFSVIILWRTNSQLDSLPVIYDVLLLTIFANLVYCIIIGLKK